MNRTGTVVLEFDPHLNPLRKNKKLWDGLSAVVQIGDRLWVANDEALSLERLSRQPGTLDGEIRYADHRQFPLHEVLPLPMPPAADGKIAEADVEGLDYQDGYLWLVGSHSLKRSQPDEDDSVERNVERLTDVKRDGNRFLLARIPLEPHSQELECVIEQGGHSRTAARLAGDEKTNELTRVLAGDEHLGPFLAVPGKDNGFDIEGLAVAGDRVFLGLRGPVLRGWAVVLELAIAELDASTLTLKPIGPEGRPYRKHFLDLQGLGIRDLCRQGSDLLILAGPTLALAGPLTIFRWPSGARPERESLVFNAALPTVLELLTDAGPKAGQEQAEGLTLFGLDRGEATNMLVIYDSPAPRRRRGTRAVEADLFVLP